MSTAYPINAPVDLVNTSAGDILNFNANKGADKNQIVNFVTRAPGDIITGASNTSLTRIPPGTVGQVLTAGTSGVAEISELTTVAAAGDVLDGTYFLINTPGENYYVWYSSNTATDPGLADSPPADLIFGNIQRTGVQVSILTADTPTDVATKTIAILDTLIGFDSVGTTSAVDVMTIQNADPGAVATVSDGATGTGFTSISSTQTGVDSGPVVWAATAAATAVNTFMATVTSAPNPIPAGDKWAYLDDQGAAATELTEVITIANTTNVLIGTHFLMYESAGSVAVYYVTTIGDAPPAHGADRDIEVIVAVNISDVAMASTTAGAINTDGVFSAVATGNQIVITHDAIGKRIDTADVDTTFTFNLLTDGATNSVVVWDDSTNPNHDAGASFNTTTGIYSPPASGIYQMSCMVTFQGNNSGNGGGGIPGRRAIRQARMHNITTDTSLAFNEVQASASSYNPSTVVLAVAAVAVDILDQIVVQVRHDASVSLNIGFEEDGAGTPGPATYFSASRIA